MSLSITNIELLIYLVRIIINNYAVSTFGVLNTFIVSDGTYIVVTA